MIALHALNIFSEIIGFAHSTICIKFFFSTLFFFAYAKFCSYPADDWLVYNTASIKWCFI